MKPARALLFLFVVSLLTACAQLGLPSAGTFNERLAVGYTTVTTVRQSATTLLVAKKITADDAQNVLSQTDNARAGLDIARTMSKADPKAADAKLTAIRTILTGLQTYLTSKGAQ